MWIQSTKHVSGFNLAFGFALKKLKFAAQLS